MIEEDDEIFIDIPNRIIEAKVSEKEFLKRRNKMAASQNPYSPGIRDRKVSLALRAYAKLTTSAAQGAVRAL